MHTCTHHILIYVYQQILILCQKKKKTIQTTTTKLTHTGACPSANEGKSLFADYSFVWLQVKNTVCQCACR